MAPKPRKSTIPARTRTRKLSAVDAKKRAIEIYRDTGIVRDAIEGCGYSRATWWDWIEKDPEFAAAVEQAKEDAIEVLEREARRRARETSDVLLIFLLKAARPEIYRDRIDARLTGDAALPIRIIVERGQEPQE